MTHAVWVAASLLFIFFGFSPRSMDRPSRLAIRFATGIVIGGTVLWIESLVGIPWNRLTLGVPMLLFAVGCSLFVRHPGQQTANDEQRIWPIGIIALLAFYGAATARQTNADLLYFWGPKGQRFFFAETIDVGFLKFAFNYLMHPDYPPLQPIVYAWSSIAAHGFSYWGALVLTPIYLLATVLVFRGFAAGRLGERNATAFATLFAALLAFGYNSSVVAGGADAQLILFEILALSALTFAEDATLVAAIALAGAAFTKVEGAAFIAVVVVAFAVLKRDLRRAAILATPAVVLLGSWIVFARHEQMLDSYALGGKPLHFSQLPVVLSIAGEQAGFRALYLPWILAIVPLGIGRKWRPAALPLLVAAGAVAYTIFFYLHAPDAAFWVRSSAQRVLLTPLTALLVASAAASE